MALAVHNAKPMEVSGKRKGAVTSHLFPEVEKSRKVHEGPVREWKLGSC